MASTIKDAPTNPGPDENRVECRVYPRKTCDIPTKCHPASLEAREVGWHAAIVDLSQGGVRIQLMRRYERGTALTLELPGDGQREPSEVFVKVIHVRRHDDGTWLLGCQFVSELSEDEVNRLLSCKNPILSPDDDGVEPVGDEI